MTNTSGTLSGIIPVIVRDDVISMQESGAHQKLLDSLLIHVPISHSLQLVRGELHCLVVGVDQYPIVLTYL